MDYYEVLGITRDASDDDIKKAFRKLVKIHHPDKDNSSGASQKIKEIYEAYSVLKNKREEYNKRFETESENVKKGPDLTVVINAKAVELVKCVSKHIIIKRQGLCSDCGGTGALSRRVKKCIYCGGTGYQGLSVILRQKKKCLFCSGNTVAPDGPVCVKCGGKGLVEEILREKIELNPLSFTIILPGKGHYSLGSKIPGNCVIDVITEQHPNYFIRGLNIESQVTISPVQAIIGDSIDLTFFDRKVELKVPSGIKDGQYIFKKNAGLTLGHRMGYLKIRVNVIIPQIITEREKELYQEILLMEKEITPWPKTIALT